MIYLPFWPDQLQILQDMPFLTTMATYKAQEFLFQRIKELLPPHVSLVDAVAETLHLSSDSAYRRIRGETPMVLDEVKELCQFYKISLDQLLDVKTGDRKSTRLNSSHIQKSRMPSSA